MTVLLATVPPALCNVEPKTAKKMIGAIKLLRAKKYWTLMVLVKSMSRPEGGGARLAAGSYLGVRYAEEGDLKHEVEHKATHSCRGDALASGYSIGDVGKAWPDGCEQDGHALTASCGLDTVCG